MDIFHTKLLIALFYLISTFIFCIIPLLISSWFNKKHSKSNSKRNYISNLNCFGGGVFVGGCLLDLYPDVVHHINETLKSKFNYPNENEYPIAEICIVFSFFLILFLEQSILTFRSKIEKKKTNCLLESNEIQTAEGDLSMNRNLLMMFSLVIHSIFEGIAIGSLGDNSTVIQLSFAIFIHKSIIALSFTFKLMSKGTHRWIYLCCFVFSCSTPFGIVIMLTMQRVFAANKSIEIVNDLLRAFSCGTFFYITFVDILPNEFNHSNTSNRLMKSCCLFCGLISIVGLICLTKSFSH